MKIYDFVIVGGGIAGASVAARLAEHASVLVLEKEHAPGYHSTGRSAALYSALYGNASISAMTRASRGFFANPPTGFSEYSLLSPREVLYAGGESDLATVDKLCLSPLARRISTTTVIEKVPVITRASAVHCALETDAFDVDVNALHQGFLRRAKSLGAEIRCNAGVTSLIKRAGSWSIGSPAGDFTGSVVINAAGAWADSLASLAGVRELVLQPLRRTAMIIDSPDPGSSRWPAVFAADESCYFKPDAGMILASLADETPSDPCDAQPEELDIAVCVDRIETRTTMTIKRVVRSWAGLRTFAADRTPVVGYDSVDSGFFWLAGQGGYGIQTAPALADAAAALALRADIPAYILAEGLLPASISPERFSAG